VKNRSLFVLLIVMALVCMPVIASGESSANSTVVVTTIPPVTESVVNTTTAVTTATPASTPGTNTTASVTLAGVTSVTQTTSVPVQNITAITPSPVGYTTAPVSVGNITAASSPLGASVLIDGVYYGVTPREINGIPAGNHIVRLTLSGYYDYEGTIYVVPGQVNTVYGTLPPLSGHGESTTARTPEITASATTPVPSVTVQPTTTSSAGALENPTVIAAIIGIVTASIGAAATIFTHYAKLKKD